MADDDAEQIEKEEDKDALDQRGQPRKETVNHLVSGFPKLCEVWMHNLAIIKAEHRRMLRTQIQ